MCCTATQLPLEALLQRFGRVNRGQPAGSPLKPVYVCTQPDDGQHVYRAELVQAALGVLQGLNGQVVDEAQVDALLAAVYQASWLKRGGTTTARPLMSLSRPA